MKHEMVVPADGVERYFTPAIAAQIREMEKYILKRPVNALEVGGISVYLTGHPEASAIEAFYETQECTDD